MPEQPKPQRDEAKTLLNTGIAITFTLSLLSNLLRAITEDGTFWFSSQPAVVLLAVPGVLFLVLVIARIVLHFFRRRGTRHHTVS